MHILYIFMRTDLTSLNPGKAMAQAAHASNAFLHRAKKVRFFDRQVKEWKRETDQGFGTTIVLAVKDDTDLLDAVSHGDHAGCPRGIVIDPSYPVRDGTHTHHVKLATCGYLFIPHILSDRKPQSTLHP